MASYPVGASGCSAEHPRVRIAVIRHQGETMLSPSHDIVPFLQAQGEDRWAVTVFDERDFGGALGAMTAFDLIVLGYNATTFTSELRAALCAAPPSAPVLLLHQRDQPCFDFLRGGVEIEVVKLGEGVSEAVTPHERRESFEPLLNWPNTGVTTDGKLTAKAIRGLSFSPDGAWRVVMEVQRAAHRLPVLIRTRADHPQRIVACSLLLRPATDDEHGKLLENLLVYCAFGWPDVGLVAIDGDEDSTARVQDLALGMGMWTERSVRVTVPDSGTLPLDVWPLRGVKRIVAPEALAPDLGTESAAAWLRRGGELIRVDATGRITVDARVNDRFIVLQKWAMWLAGLPEEAWVQRLSTARAVLGMLQAVSAERSDLLADLRFSVEPSQYRDEVARLLGERVRGGNVDETISATTAALDLDRLTGGDALPNYVRVRARRWLKTQLEDASPTDQLDILRCLGEADLLKQHLSEWKDVRVDALLATRLREAVHACWPRGGEPAKLVSKAVLAELDGDQVLEDLRHGPLLCAEFLAALYCRPPGAKGALFDPERYRRSEAEAVDHISAVGLYDDPQHVGPVCAHTLAILRHLERRPAGLRFLADRGELPSSAAQSVLEEATKARDREREARRELPALGKAVFALGAVTLALAVVGLLDLWRISGFTVSIRPWWLILPIALVPAGALAALRWYWIDNHVDSEERDHRLAQHTTALAALALSAVPATLAWRIGSPKGDINGFAIALGIAAGLTTFTALLVVLASYNLTPRWATRVPEVFGDLKGPLTALTKRLSGKSAGT